MYRFAFRGRWLVGHLIVLALGALFVFAGFWQLDRLDQRRALNATIRQRMSLPMAQVEQLLDAMEASPQQAESRRVEASGRYDRDREAIVLSRTQQGRPGEYVLTPLILSDGTAVIVNRGWIPTSGAAEAPPPEATAPAEEVRVTGLALAGEGESRPLARFGPDGPLELTRIDLAALGAQLPYDIPPLYLQLQRQDPPQPSAIPEPVPSPDLGEGPHLSYAVQWFLFTGVALVGWPLLVRRAAKDRAQAASHSADDSGVGTGRQTESRLSGR